MAVTYHTAFPAEWLESPTLLSAGCLLRIDSGQATLHVNFRSWTLRTGAVATLFPHQMAHVVEASPDLRLRLVTYSEDILREASLQMEKAVFEALRADCVCQDSEPISLLTDALLTLLGFYFGRPGCTCLDTLVMLQLKGYFLGFYDEMLHRPLTEQPLLPDDGRSHRLFNRFMQLLETHYRESHAVADYANALCVTSKHLTATANRVAGRPAKAIINDYVISHLKLSLQHDRRSVKEIAFAYHFPTATYFCQYFRQHTGLTPQQYRTRWWRK